MDFYVHLKYKRYLYLLKSLIQDTNLMCYKAQPDDILPHIKKQFFSGKDILMIFNRMENKMLNLWSFPLLLSETFLQITTVKTYILF